MILQENTRYCRMLNVHEHLSLQFEYVWHSRVLVSQMSRLGVVTDGLVDIAGVSVT